MYFSMYTVSDEAQTSLSPSAQNKKRTATSQRHKDGTKSLKRKRLTEKAAHEEEDAGGVGEDDWSDNTGEDFDQSGNSVTLIQIICIYLSASLSL